MRIRSTKPEFWRSERVASVDWAARLVLKGLESYVDDNGVGKHDLALIVADVFPRDLSRNPTGTLRKVSEALNHLSSAGLLWLYVAHDTPLLYISFWESIQRIEKPSRGRFPRPDGTMNYRDSEIREPSRNPPVGLPEPSGLEQGNRGTGEQVKPSSSAIADATPDATSDPVHLRDDVEELLDHLDKRIADNGSKIHPRGKTARDAMRLMLDRDERTVEEIHRAIDWSQDDEFWRGVILSATKLREQYDKLRLAAKRKSNGSLDDSVQSARKSRTARTSIEEIPPSELDDDPARAVAWTREYRRAVGDGKTPQAARLRACQVLGLKGVEA